MYNKITVRVCGCVVNVNLCSGYTQMDHPNIKYIKYLRFKLLYYMACFLPCLPLFPTVLLSVA